MKSTILEEAVRYLLPVMLLFAVAVMARGHNEPGGGFVGGLVAASALTLHALTFGVARTRAALQVSPQMIIGLGLLLAVSSAFVGPVLFDHPFMTGEWHDVKVAVLSFSTPALFDIGVMLVVVGVTVLIVFTLSEETAPHVGATGMDMTPTVEVFQGEDPRNEEAD